MTRTPLSPDNSAIVLIDHAIGFSNLIGSHTPEENVSGAVALAKIAKVFDMPLVVTNGFDDAPSGPLYPELADVLGDHPVIRRRDGFDAFYDEDFAAAIETTGRRRLIMAGVQTDVCLVQTALTAIDRGHEVYVVVDASAATTKETHDTAVLRLIQAGAIPTNWLAIGSE
ncbi:MAG: isochorismatase family protein, partial [Pseudonocardia sp.]